MDKKTLSMIIPAASLIIFFVWGWLDTFQHSWLIFVVSGVAMAVISNMDKNKKADETKPVVKEEPKPVVKDENKNAEEPKPEEK